MLGAPGGTFTYTWNTFAWPTTAGVWLYHDHSICDMDNVNSGAIGIIVIHNNDPSKHSPSDPDDVTVDVVDLPNGSPNGSLTHLLCFPFPFEAQALPHDLEGVGQVGHHQQEPMMQDMPGGGMPMGGKTGGMKEEAEATAVTDLVNYTSFFDFNGCPSISVPAGFTKAGLPVGLMLSGRPFDEPGLLRLAYAYQEETGFNRQRPRLG